jgi:DNA-binding response OmpR family regulator
MKSFYLENEEILQRVVSRVFQESSHDIYTKAASKEWFYLIKDLAPDLLIIDLDSLESSPAGNWEDLVSTQIPVMVTHREEREVPETIRNCPLVCQFLSKPFSPFEFLKAVENLLVSH